MAKKTRAVITGVKETREDLLAFIRSRLKDEKILNQIGTTATDQIKKRTLSNLEKYAQPKLKETTIEVRRLLSEVNGSGDFFKADRSNLTFSGQLLNAIRHRVVASASNIFIFLIENRRQTQPLSKAERKHRYDEIIDNDHNATNKARRDPKDKARLAALYIASKPTEKKTNTEIAKDLKERGREFLFISEPLRSQLQDKLARLVGAQLTLYKRIKRKLSR